MRESKGGCTGDARSPEPCNRYEGAQVSHLEDVFISISALVEQPRSQNQIEKGGKMKSDNKDVDAPMF